MIRTKHIAIFFAFLIVALVISLLYFSRGNIGSVFSAGPQGKALVIDAITESDSIGAVIEKDTTREETRASIIAQLKNFNPPAEPEPAPEPEVETPPVVIVAPEPREETPQPKAPQFCNTAGYGTQIATWDGMKTAVVEGRRVVSSLEEKEDGSPLHSFDVAALPSITGSQGCLPLGMIGVALDGRVLQSGKPFVTNPQGLVGYALDGFGIFGMYEDGAFVKEDSLDACHGHIHSIMWDESLVSMYHYHVTETSPYTLGCFRGIPATAE